ncbi:actin-7-related [Anaeramoeba flamelloides]|uniref:Actin-7-related n=1 Tax=Anaeramoeba flamelloides TaxID=1746091 RepID=A0ABQ8YCJ5_9EUKA|nr:actin-7-related [Anaeramoeba flamelloides]
MSTKVPVVLDPGSFTIKAGFAGESTPKVYLPSVVGLTEDFETLIGLDKGSFYVGESTFLHQGISIINYTHSKGVVKDWEDMDRVLSLTLNEELNIKGEEHPVLVCEPIENTYSNRNSFAELLFEAYNVPSISFQPSGALALYGQSKTPNYNELTGICLEIGETLSQITPIVNGQIQVGSAASLPIGGRNITNYLLQSINLMGDNFSSTSDRETIRELKEKCSFVSLDFENELEQSKKTDELVKEYVLPDYSKMKLNSELFVCTEILFDPRLIGYEKIGIHDLLFRAITMCPNSEVEKMCNNFLLTGGSSKIESLRDRILFEYDSFKEKFGSKNNPIELQLNQTEHPEFDTWVGGSKWALASYKEKSQKNAWVTKDEWKESEKKIFNTKDNTFSDIGYKKISLKQSENTKKSKKYDPIVNRKGSELISKNLGTASVVVDLGSRNLRAGYSNEDLPESVFKMLAGHPFKKEFFTEEEMSKTFIGKEAQEKRNILSLQFPYNKGKIENWDDFEKILFYTFYNEMEIETKNYDILLTEPAYHLTSQRQKITQIMMETFNFSSIYYGMQGLLSHYTLDVNTSVVVDVGEEFTQIVPVYHGHTINSAVTRINLGGRKVTKYFKGLLSQDGYRFNTSAQNEIVYQVKNKYCYVPLSLDEENKKSKEGFEQERYYEKKDGELIELITSHFRCTEMLFDPKIINEETDGLSKAIYKSIMKCAISTRAQLLNNIVLVGGTSLTPGISQRIHKDLSLLFPNAPQINVVTPEKRLHSAWRGGAILSSLDSYQGLPTTLEEYEENGPVCVDHWSFSQETVLDSEYLQELNSNCGWQMAKSTYSHQMKNIKEKNRLTKKQSLFKDKQSKIENIIQVKENTINKLKNENEKLLTEIERLTELKKKKSQQN